MPNSDGKGTHDHPQVDYDIHGLVGVRLIDPSPSDVAAVEKDLGPLQKPLLRQPDIVIRFVKHLPTPGLRYIGLESGFTDDGFFVLGSGKEELKVRIPFDQVGGEQCEIICESGLQSVPQLTKIVHLTVLKRDHVALHASAFVHKGTGILSTGWTKGGKTEALFAFASRGAEYVGDEWVLLSGDGQTMYGIPGSILIWSWQFDYLARLWRQVRLEERLVFKTIGALDWIQRMIPNGRLRRSFPARFLRDAMPMLRRRMHVRMTPRFIFGPGYGSLRAKPDKVFFLMGHKSPIISVEPMDPLEIVRRMVWSIQFEQAELAGQYLAFKFAFPGVRNEFLEHASELQRDILCRALEGKQGYVVRHPYPVSLPELYKAMEPFSGGSRRDAPALSPEHSAAP